MDRHLTEAAIEALAHGRDDLVRDEERAHAASCASCASAIDDARAFSRALAPSLAEAAPIPADLDAMVAAAMAHLPSPARAPELAVPRASRGALALAFVIGLVAAVGLGIAAIGDIPSIASAISGVREVVVLGTAIDRVVDVAVPGGWVTISLAGCVLLALLAVPLRSLVQTTVPARAVVIMLASLAAFGAFGSRARAVEFEGEWPAGERVSVVADHRPTSDALRMAAESAGLGLVATLPADPEVTVHVRDVPLRDVMTAILGDAPVVASRSDRLIVIRPIDAASAGTPAEPTEPAEPVAPVEPPQPPEPPEPPGPPPRDRVTFGGDAVVRAGERVRGVVTMGGDAIIEGEVLGDVVTMGGDITVRRGAVVHGEMVTMGGEVVVEEGAQAEGERVQGRISLGDGGRGLNIRVDDDDDDAERGAFSALGAFGGWLRDALHSASRHALLFLLGLLVLGLAPERLGALQRTIARAPARSIATGLLGFVGAAVLTVVLAITIIGIPAAILVALGAFVAVYVGIVASATILGRALPLAPLRDRPIAQLAAGIGVLFLASLVPVLGTLLSIAAAVVGFGAVLLTRFRKVAPGDLTG